MAQGLNPKPATNALCKGQPSDHRRQGRGRLLVFNGADLAVQNHGTLCQDNLASSQVDFLLKALSRLRVVRTSLLQLMFCNVLVAVGFAQ